MSKFWRHFITNGLSRPVDRCLGLHGHGVSLSQPSFERFDLGRAGMKIQTIDSRGPAEKAGILEGDILIRLAGRPTTGLNGLNRLLPDLPAGVPLQVILLRRRSSWNVGSCSTIIPKRCGSGAKFLRRPKKTGTGLVILATRGASLTRSGRQPLLERSRHPREDLVPIAPTGLAKQGGCWGTRANYPGRAPNASLATLPGPAKPAHPGRRPGGRWRCPH